MLFILLSFVEIKRRFQYRASAKGPFRARCWENRAWISRYEFLVILKCLIYTALYEFIVNKINKPWDIFISTEIKIV